METNSIVVNIARDFSKFPAGRFLEDGPYSGQLFRERFLEPALQEKKRLVIELDGVPGYGSSFIEEAFGGLRRKGFTETIIRSLLTLHSSDPSLPDEIWDAVAHGADKR